MSGNEDAVQEAVRLAVRELANEGRPVDLGERALRRRAAPAGPGGRRLGPAVMAVVAAAALWPGFGRHTAVPPAGSDAGGRTRPGHLHGPRPVPGPRRRRARPPSRPLRRRPGMVISAYLTPERRLRVLDPTTGAYCPAPGTALLMAVSPDLRYAVIGPSHRRPDPVRRAVHQYEFGIYDAVTAGGGQAWTWRYRSGQFTATEGLVAGRPTVAVALRAGLDNGGGWLVRAVALVEVETGEVRASGSRRPTGWNRWQCSAGPTTARG